MRGNEKGQTNCTVTSFPMPQSYDTISLPNNQSDMELDMNKCAVVFLASMASLATAAEPGIAEICKTEIKEGGLFADDDSIKTKCREYYAGLIDKTPQIEADAKKAAALEARRKADEERRKQEDDEIKKYKDLRTSFTPAATVPLPELSSFSTASQRSIAELGFAAGQQVAKELQAALESQTSTTPPVTRRRYALVVASDSALAQWRTSVDPQMVKARLRDINATLATVQSTKSCDVELPKEAKQPTKPELTWKLNVPAILGAQAVVESIGAIAVQFQPVLLKAASVAAPSDLSFAILSGLQSASHGTITSDPPVIAASNDIMVLANATTKALIATEEHLKRLATPKKGYKVKEACFKDLEKKAISANEQAKDMTTAESAALGSQLDRAARSVAFSDAGFDYLLDLRPIVSGGAVTGYQRTRFNAVKLIMGSDIALAYRLVTPDGRPIAANMVSMGRGRAIPLGEFDSIYNSQVK